MTSNSSAGVSSQVDGVVLRFPAKPGYLSLCRVNASTVGSMLGFNLDELDDLRLAVNESVTWLLLGSGSAEGIVELELEGSDGELRLVATRHQAGLTDEPVDDLVGAILGATVDSYATSSSTDRRQMRFAKRASFE